ncbi:hypothetical protein VTH06DRAFT_7672 [Thermothelomyces fergusii]
MQRHSFSRPSNPAKLEPELVDSTEGPVAICQDPLSGGLFPTGQRRLSDQLARAPRVPILPPSPERHFDPRISRHRPARRLPTRPAPSTT